MIQCGRAPSVRTGKMENFSVSSHELRWPEKHLEPNLQRDDDAKDQISRKMRFLDKFEMLCQYSIYSRKKKLSGKYRFSSNLFTIHSPVTCDLHLQMKQKYRRPTGAIKWNGKGKTFS